MSKRVTESAAYTRQALKGLKEDFSKMAAVMFRLMVQFEELEKSLVEKGILLEGEIDERIAKQDDEV